MSKFKKVLQSILIIQIMTCRNLHRLSCFLISGQFLNLSGNWALVLSSVVLTLASVSIAALFLVKMEPLLTALPATKYTLCMSSSVIPFLSADLLFQFLLRIKRKILNSKIAKLCSRLPQDPSEPLLLKVLRKKFKMYQELCSISAAGFLGTVPVSPNF